MSAKLMPTFGFLQYHGPTSGMKGIATSAFAANHSVVSPARKRAKGAVRSTALSVLFCGSSNPRHCFVFSNRVSSDHLSANRYRTLIGVIARSVAKKASS